MQCVPSVMVGGVLLYLAASAAMAQQPAMQRELLLFREVPTVVTATRREQPLTQAPSAITVITAEEIRQSGATSLPELLRSVPGLDVVRGSASRVSIAARGLNREFPVRMQVLLDDLSIHEDVAGAIFWHQIPIPLEEIERIEIVRSPATALHGDKAFAGVIHIITKSPEALRGTQVSGTAGEADTGIVNLIHTGAIRNVSYKVSLGHDRTNQFPNPAVGRTGDELGRADTRGHFQANYRLAADAKIALSGGIDVFDHTEIFEGVLQGSLGFIKANYALGDFKAQLSYNYVDTDISAQRIMRDMSSRLDVYQAQLQHSLPWGRRNVLTGGLTYRYYTVDTQLVQGRRDQNLPAFFLQNEWHVRDDLTLTVGVGVDVHPQAGVFASPRGSLVYSPWQDHTFRVSVARALRNLSVYENFFSLTQEIPRALPHPLPQQFTIKTLGNADLRPEEMLAYEVGYQTLLWDRLRVRIDLFYYQLDHLIDVRVRQPIFSQVDPSLPLVQTGVEAQFMNVGHGAIVGGELGAEILITSWLKGFLNYSYQDRTGEIASMGFAPHHKGNAGLTGSFPHGLSGHVLVHHVGEATGSSGFPPMLGRVPPYTLVNVRLGYQCKVFGHDMELTIQAFNLFNDVHREVPDGDLIERRVSGTIRYHF